MVKNFMRNFVTSIVIFLIASILGFLTWIWAVSSQLFHQVLIAIGEVLGNLILWCVFVLSAGISVAIFFFCGRKLNSLGKHWLNFLSASGSLAVAIFLSAVTLNPQVLFVPILPFLLLLSLIEIDIMSAKPGIYSLVLVCVVSVLPTTITWLGMLYQSRNDEAKIKSLPQKDSWWIVPK